MRQSLRLVRRALEVGRREGLRALAGRVRQQFGGWRPDGDLLCGLDADLPEEMIVGAGNVLFLSGWCFHSRSTVSALRVVLNGVAHPVAAMKLARPDVFASHFGGRDPNGHSYASGFSVMIPFSPDDIGVRAEVALQAHLRDGTTSSRGLGSIAVVAGASPPRPEGKAPRIAICMATYNPPPALFARQVESIRGQSLPDWICFISDDASDPEAYAAIQRVVASDSRFRVSRAAERAGFYRNFERCLSFVPEGVEFVALSDHDDRWHPDKLETLLAAFGPETTLAYSDMNIVDERGELRSSTYWTNRPNRCDDLSSLLIANTITGAASLFRATLLKDLLPFPQRIGEAFHDQWLAGVALSLGRVAYVDRPLYDYVQHPSNVLGHYAPAGGGAWMKLRAYGRALARKGGAEKARSTLGGWRAVYYGDVQKVKLSARVLLARCRARLTEDKARQLRRLAALDEGWSTTCWLAYRGLMGAGRVTETLNGEATLLRGLIWRRYARVRSTVVPGNRARDASPRAATRSGDATGMERVRQIEQKIAPLRLRASRAAPPRINLLIPTIDFRYFFGGYIAKFNLARRLAEEGHRVRIVTVDYCPDRMSAWKQQVQAFEGLAGVFDRVEVALAANREQALEVSPGDSFVATTWWTAHIAHQAVRSLGRRRFVYLIQEYEPFTFPMGTFAALARESYDFPHFALFSTELLREYFRIHRIGVFAPDEQAGARDSLSFQNAITPVGPVTPGDLAGERPRRLLFYARPEAHAARNMFELGVLALSRAVAEGAFDGSWEFHGLGAVTESGRLPLGGGAFLRVQPRQSQEDYRQFLLGHDVGLSLMYTPHPSLVPLEMASAGMLVVTNSFENKTPESLGAISRNIIVAEPTVTGVTAALRQAASGAGDHERRVAGSRVAWSTHWDRSFDQGILARIREFVSAGPQ